MIKVCLQDFIAFYDTGCGMTFQTLQNWAKWRSLPAEDAGMIHKQCMWCKQRLCSGHDAQLFCILYHAGSAGAAGVSPYFADGNLSCFGMGSKVQRIALC